MLPSKFKKPVVEKKPTEALRLLEKISKEMRKPGQIRIGIPAGSNAYPDGTSVIMVGAVQEFGSPGRGIPERSYLRSTINEKRRVYKALLAKLGAKIGTGEITSAKAMSILGTTVQADVQEKIRKIRTPPNAPRTILEKGTNNPLIDDGHLRQVITWILEDDRKRS